MRARIKAGIGLLLVSVMLSGCMSSVKGLRGLRGRPAEPQASEKIDPVKVHFLLGTDHADKGEYDQAIAAFTKALEIDPSYSPAYLTRGSTYYLKGMYSKAIEDFNMKDAAAFLGEDSEGWHAFHTARGHSYLELKRYDLALADLNKAVSKKPKGHEAYFYRGRVLMEKKQYDAALADFTTAIRLDPRFADAYLFRAACYDSLGAYDKARVDLDAAERLGGPKEKQAIQEWRRSSERYR